MEVARRARDGVRDARREAWGVRDLRRESPRVLVVVDAVELAHLVAHHLEGLHVPEWTRGLSEELRGIAPELRARIARRTARGSA